MKENQMGEIMYDLMDNKLVQYNKNVLVDHMAMMTIIEHIQYRKKIDLIEKYYVIKNNDRYEFEFDLIH
jgi:transcription initiation factor IIE alpha subunit